MRQQNEKATSNYSRTTWEEALQLFKDWEKSKLRDCNYRNHRIFTLKCISNELIPVSLRLKTTLKTNRAKKIIRKAEKDPLQARVKSINSILGDNSKQTELGRSKLASRVSTNIMDKCLQFIDNVSELRFLKIKERQVNKFNRLLLKKQGNITWYSSSPQLIPTQGMLDPRQLAPLAQTGNSWEGSAAQTASTSFPQTVNSKEKSAAQAASTSSPQTVSSQAVSFQAVALRLVIPGKRVLAQAASASPPQTVSP